MPEKTFEEMLNDLENVVRNLESGRVGLEDALKASLPPGLLQEG